MIAIPTSKQEVGAVGERLVIKHCICPRCKRKSTLKRLPTNFKCADVVCDFCGYLGQVKTKKVASLGQLPRKILGAAWKVQEERMNAGIYFPLFIVMVTQRGKFSIYYLCADLQNREMFVPRTPLSDAAKRKGWQGFTYDLSQVPRGAIVYLAGHQLDESG